ncbi:MAG: hypothetical protein LH470_01090 [Lysobacter sp.]|nr:hypothetical protein [Lysobacter sp.]
MDIRLIREHAMPALTCQFVDDFISLSVAMAARMVGGINATCFQPRGSVAPFERQYLAPQWHSATLQAGKHPFPDQAARGLGDGCVHIYIKHTWRSAGWPNLTNRSHAMSSSIKSLASHSAATAAIALSLSLSACMTTVPPVTGGPMPPMEDRCNADLAKSAIGKAATAQVVEQARIDARADVARVLRPGQMVTMEFRAGRLNVDVNDRNAIIGLRCG